MNPFDIGGLNNSGSMPINAGAGPSNAHGGSNYFAVNPMNQPPSNTPLYIALALIAGAAVYHLVTK